MFGDIPKGERKEAWNGLFIFVTILVIMLGIIAIGLTAILCRYGGAPSCATIADDLITCSGLSANPQCQEKRLQAYETCVQYQDVQQTEVEQ